MPIDVDHIDNCAIRSVRGTHMRMLGDFYLCVTSMCERGAWTMPIDVDDTGNCAIRSVRGTHMRMLGER